jgi:hypothetical protein
MWHDAALLDDTSFSTDRAAMEQAKETARKIGHLRVILPYLYRFRFGLFHSRIPSLSASTLQA